MNKLFTLLLAVMALSWTASASAKIKKHDLEIGSAMEVGTVNLKPGTYQVAVVDNDFVVYSGSKELAKVPVKVEELNAKNHDTEILSNPGGKIAEIRLSGESRKLVLSN